MITWIRLGTWFGRTAGAPVGAARRPAMDLLQDSPGPEDERPYGCGWFDSSLDLRQGLAVVEHQCIDLGLALDLLFAPDATRH